MSSKEVACLLKAINFPNLFLVLQTKKWKLPNCVEKGIVWMVGQQLSTNPCTHERSVFGSSDWHSFGGHSLRKGIHIIGSPVPQRTKNVSMCLVQPARYSWKELIPGMNQPSSLQTNWHLMSRLCVRRTRGRWARMHWRHIVSWWPQMRSLFTQSFPVVSCWRFGVVLVYVVVTRSKWGNLVSRNRSRNVCLI